MFQGTEVMKETGYGNAWGFFFDAIHHRGQLSTYLRPMGANVPSIYGPSGDEQSELKRRTALPLTTSV